VSRRQQRCVGWDKANLTWVTQKEKDNSGELDQARRAQGGFRNMNRCTAMGQEDYSRIG
jgi:hypothetical protein